jgi:hypothetical protein
MQRQVEHWRQTQITEVRLIEAQAALAYWTAWRTLPINFPRNDLRRVPAHWLNFGTRISPLARSPRLSVTAPLLDSPDPQAQMWQRGLTGLAGRCQITLLEVLAIRRARAGLLCAGRRLDAMKGPTLFAGIGLANRNPWAEPQPASANRRC